MNPEVCESIGTDWAGWTVLAVHPGALGDLLLVVPALDALRRRGARRLILAARGEGAALLRSAGFADEVWNLDGAWAAPLFAGERPRETPGDGPDRPDAAAVFLRKADPALRRGVERLAGRVVVADAGDEGRHVAECWAAPWGAIDRSRAWLRSWALRQDPGDVPGSAIVVHPGSGSPRKNWPLERWANLLRAIRRETNRPLIVLEGPAEAGRGGELIDRMGGNGLLLREEPLRRVAAVLSRADLYLGNDSGISHLAGPAGAASVTVFGPTRPERWAPLGPRVRAVSPADGPGPVSEVAVERVIESVRDLMMNA